MGHMVGAGRALFELFVRFGIREQVCLRRLYPYGTALCPLSSEGPLLYVPAYISHARISTACKEAHYRRQSSGGAKTRLERLGRALASNL